jgi:hypothetical protein
MSIRMVTANSHRRLMVVLLSHFNRGGANPLFRPYFFRLPLHFLLVISHFANVLEMSGDAVCFRNAFAAIAGWGWRAH